MNENAPAASETVCAVCEGETDGNDRPGDRRVGCRVDHAATQACRSFRLSLRWAWQPG